MYRYEHVKQFLFTDDGQKMFLKVRDFANEALAHSGAIRMAEAMKAAGGGDSWAMMACVDRLVELGELKEIEQECYGQHRVFIRQRPVK